MFGIVGLIFGSSLPSLRKSELRVPQLRELAANRASYTNGIAGHGDRTIKPGTNGEPALGLISEAAIRDGEMILEQPIPEFFMIYQTLTNSGVPADRSKSALRPILNQVIGVSHWNRMLVSDAHQLTSMMDDIRNDGDRPNEERAFLIASLAASSEPYRLSFTTRRDSHLRELTFLVNQLGAKDPEGLLRRILWAEPVDPPPAPAVQE